MIEKNDMENNFKSLTTQATKVFICIDFPKTENGFFLGAYNLYDLYESLSLYMFAFAFVIHDKDINEDGELKTPHIHLFIRASKRHQLKYFLYLVADILHCNENLISIKVADCEEGCIQYLTHKNNPDKFQYDKKLIKHNYNADMFDELYDMEVLPKMTGKDLIDMCRSHSKLELIQMLGPSRYQLMSRVIDNIYNELEVEYRRSQHSIKHITINKKYNV